MYSRPSNPVKKDGAKTTSNATNAYIAANVFQRRELNLDSLQYLYRTGK